MLMHKSQSVAKIAKKLEKIPQPKVVKYIHVIKIHVFEK